MDPVGGSDINAVDRENFAQQLMATVKRLINDKLGVNTNRLVRDNIHSNKVTNSGSRQNRSI